MIHSATDGTSSTPKTIGFPTLKALSFLGFVDCAILTASNKPNDLYFIQIKCTAREGNRYRSKIFQLQNQRGMLIEKSYRGCRDYIASVSKNITVIENPYNP